MSDFSQGAVGVVDALGFKGIWNRYPLDAVRRTLEEIRKYALEEVSKMMKRLYAHGVARPFEIAAFSFSDTVIFTAVTSKAERSSDALAGAAGLVAAGISYLMRRAVCSEVPLIFRGAIATGECFVDHDRGMFLGPAVDEASELEKKAEGAFVWLSPETCTLDLNDWNRRTWENLLSQYDVPLKGCSPIRTKVVNPFVHVSHVADEFAKIRDGYLSFLSSKSRPEATDREDVVRKRVNTEKLLVFFEEQARKQAVRMQLEHEWKMEMRRREREGS